jgi:HEAT repeat protein
VSQELDAVLTIRGLREAVEAGVALVEDHESGDSLALFLVPPPDEYASADGSNDAPRAWFYDHWGCRDFDLQESMWWQDEGDPDNEDYYEWWACWDLVTTNGIPDPVLKALSEQVPDCEIGWCWEDFDDVYYEHIWENGVLTMGHLGEPLEPETDQAAETVFADDLKAMASRDESKQLAAASRLLESGEAAVPTLLTGLRSRSVNTRLLCSEILMRHADADDAIPHEDAVVAALIEALGDRSPNVVVWSSVTLGLAATPEGIAALKSAAAGKGAVQRAAANAGLYASGDERAHDELLRLLSKGTVRARWAAALSMIIVGRPGRDLRALRERLVDSDADVREAAANAIAQIEEAADATGEDSHHSDYGDGLTEDSEPSLKDADRASQRVRALVEELVDSTDDGLPSGQLVGELLAELETQADALPIPVLVDALRVKNRRVIEYAARMLTDRDRAATPMLVAALSDEDWSVRYGAARALRDIRDSSAAEALLAALRDESDSLVRQQVDWALRGVCDAVATRLGELLTDPEDPLLGAAWILSDGTGPATDVLIAATRDDRPEVRLAAIQALGSQKAAPATDVLISATRDVQPEVRLAAIQALGRQEAAPTAVPHLIRMLESNQVEERAAAAESLGSHGNVERHAPLLAGALVDDSREVRIAAAEGLSRMCEEDEARDSLIAQYGADAFVRLMVEAVSLGPLQDDDTDCSEGGDWIVEAILAASPTAAKEVALSVVMGSPELWSASLEEEIIDLISFSDEVEDVWELDRISLRDLVLPIMHAKDAKYFEGWLRPVVMDQPRVMMAQGIKIRPRKPDALDRRLDPLGQYTPRWYM